MEQYIDPNVVKLRAVFVFEPMLKSYRLEVNPNQPAKALSEVLDEIADLAAYIPASWSVSQEARDLLAKLFSSAHMANNGQSVVMFALDAPVRDDGHREELLELVSDVVEAKNKTKWLLKSGVAMCSYAASGTPESIAKDLECGQDEAAAVETIASEPIQAERRTTARP